VDRLNDIFRMRGEKGAGYNLNAYMFAVMNANATMMEVNMRVSPALRRIIEKSGWGAKWRAEGEIEGEARGGKSKAMDITRNLLDMGLPVDKIAKATGIPQKEIKRLRTDG
jgi:predicted transposase YdaD